MRSGADSPWRDAARRATDRSRSARRECVRVRRRTTSMLCAKTSGPAATHGVDRLVVTLEVADERLDEQVRAERLQELARFGRRAPRRRRAGRRDRPSSARRTGEPCGRWRARRARARAASSAPGRPVVTAQKRQPRVHTSPRSITVAVPSRQHSPTLGQCASSQTVKRSSSRNVLFELVVPVATRRPYPEPGGLHAAEHSTRRTIGRPAPSVPGAARLRPKRSAAGGGRRTTEPRRYLFGGRAEILGGFFLVALQVCAERVGDEQGEARVDAAGRQPGADVRILRGAYRAPP